MNYPIDAITAKDKTEYLYIAQEVLRLLNNKFVEWHEDGLLQANYDTLPTDIKKKYGFTNSINLPMLKRWINEDFMPRSANICQELVVERGKLSKSDRDEIIGTQGVDNEEGIVGTKANLLRSERWNVDASKIEKAVKGVTG